MTYDLPVTKRTVSGAVGAAAILFFLWLLTWAAPAMAIPAKAIPAKTMSTIVPQPADASPPIHQAKIFKRGRTPVYPYAAKGPGPNGWSSYFGFVPYTPGNVENEAIQRSQYPSRYWPHNPNAPIPDPYRADE